MYDFILISLDALTINNLSIYISNDEEDPHQQKCTSFFSVTAQNVRGKI